MDPDKKGWPRDWQVDAAEVNNGTGDDIAAPDRRQPSHRVGDRTRRHRVTPPLGSVTPAGKGGRDMNHMSSDESSQGHFLPPKLMRPRHVDLEPGDRRRLHGLLRAIHGAVFVGRADLAMKFAAAAARLVCQGGTR